MTEYLFARLDELNSAITTLNAVDASLQLQINALVLPSLGTGVATALAINVGSAGSIVVNGGALGSPSSAGTMPLFTFTSPLKVAGALQFQTNGTTFAGNINTSQQWSFGQNTTPVSGVRVTISDNVSPLLSMSGFTPTLLVGGADTTRGIIAIQTFATGNEASYLGFSTQGTAASPLSTVSGQYLVEFFGHGYTTLGGTPGWQHNSGGGFIVNATENYTATAQGSTVDIYATPTGTATTQLGLSVGAISSTFTGGVTVGAAGAASGTSRGVSIRSATTGAGAGGTFQLMDDSFTVTLAVANASSLLGTAYDPTMLFYSGTNAYRFNGLTAGLFTSSSNGTVSITAAGQIAGTATNDSAAAGKVGEYIFSEILSGSGVSLTTATAKDITTISLTAGDWDVWGNVGFNPAGSTTASLYFGWISTTANTLPGVVPNKGAMVIQTQNFGAGSAQIMPVGLTRLSLSVTTTVSLGVQANFAVSTMSAYGFIGARRVR